jgi:hypothetical protein
VSPKKSPSRIGGEAKLEVFHNKGKGEEFGGWREMEVSLKLVLDLPYGISKSQRISLVIR